MSQAGSMTRHVTEQNHFAHLVIALILELSGAGVPRLWNAGRRPKSTRATVALVEEKGESCSLETLKAIRGYWAP